MASPRYKTIVRLDRVGGLPEDASINVYHFEGDDDGSVLTTDDEQWEEMVGPLHARLVTFYNAIEVNLGATNAGTGTITSYNMRDAAPRVPKRVTPLVFQPNGSAFPTEVALTLSFQGETESGANMARRRGRVYLGPLAVVGTVAIAADLRPMPALLDELLTAAVAMATGSANTPRLSIYSPTTANGTQSDAAWNDARLLWMDDAFDTQRRRGSKATARRTRTIND